MLVSSSSSFSMSTSTDYDNNKGRYNNNNADAEQPQLYWFGKGKHQDLADKYTSLITDTGKASEPHVELLRVATDMYHDYHKNGHHNWKLIVDSIDADLDYRAPSDAPMILQMFFINGRQQYEDLNWYQYYEHADDYQDDIEEEFTIDKEEFENILSAVYLYVHKCETSLFSDEEEDDEDDGDEEDDEDA